MSKEKKPPVMVEHEQLKLLYFSAKWGLKIAEGLDVAHTGDWPKVSAVIKQLAAVFGG